MGRESAFRCLSRVVYQRYPADTVECVFWLSPLLGMLGKLYE
jgi:hypothetical protein